MIRLIPSKSLFLSIVLAPINIFIMLWNDPDCFKEKHPTLDEMIEKEKINED